MLRCDDRFDDVGKVINIGEGFDAKKDVVESGFTRCRVFGILNDYVKISILRTGCCTRNIPYRGLNRSFPNNRDLVTV